MMENKLAEIERQKKSYEWTKKYMQYRVLFKLWGHLERGVAVKYLNIQKLTILKRLTNSKRKKFNNYTITQRITKHIRQRLSLFTTLHKDNNYLLARE